MNYRVGIDIGGTFTDFALLKGDEVILHKNLSTPEDRSLGVMEGLSTLAAKEGLALGDFLQHCDAIVHGTTVADSWDVHGYFWGAALSDGTTTRLLHSSLSELDATTSDTSGVYASDWNAASPATPTNATVDTWGLANGPVTVDAEGNAFAVMTDYINGNQTLRAWPSTTVAPGTAASATGAELWDVPGFGSSLAAMAPAGTDGLAFYQPQTFDGNGVVSEDVTLQRYEVVGDAIEAVGAATTGIDLVTDNTEVVLFVDGAGRLWVGVADSLSSAIFYVFDRDAR